MVRRRQFGSIRKLPSGRWQARVLDAMGGLVPLGTYATKSDADQAISRAASDQSKASWVDPRRGQLTLETYAEQWMTNRVELRPLTRQLYRGLLDRHILPRLGHVELGKLTVAAIRHWHARLLSAEKPGPVTVAKSYRLLRTVLATAVEDELIVKNPCIIKGAGVERSNERPIATVAQVQALAEAVPDRYRALVLMATYTGLRLGELGALRRRSIDLLHGRLTVVEQLVELGDGSLHFGPPKTKAGRRTVAIPAALLPDIERHLSTWAGPGPDDLVFRGVRGGPIRRSHWDAAWRKARATVEGAENLHFHDLRHTGNTLAAATGASTRELMARMGHASPRAALIYQHATEDRDAAIASALSDLMTGASEAASDVVVPLTRKQAPKAQ